ncbi:alkane hydroxylase MAH1-like protein, partial [Tanacetum coccineum]
MARGGRAEGEGMDCGSETMADSVIISETSSNSSQLNPPSRMICRVCQKQFSQYTCPRCNTRYCSLPCYKSHSLRCTESFMRDNVMGEMQQLEPGDETKQKMLDILKRFHSEEEADSMDNEDGLVDSALSEETIQKIMSGMFVDYFSFKPQMGGLVNLGDISELEKISVPNLGDWESDPVGSTTVVLSISSVLGQNAQPETVSEALSYCLEQTGMFGMRLCDLHRMIKAGMKEVKMEKTHKEIKGQLKSGERKVYFLMCWVHEQPQEAWLSLAGLVTAEKNAAMDYKGNGTGDWRAEKKAERKGKVIIEEVFYPSLSARYFCRELLLVPTVPRGAFSSSWWKNFSETIDVLGDGIFSSDGKIWEIGHNKVTMSTLNHFRFQSMLETIIWNKVETGLLPIFESISANGCEMDLQDIDRFSFDTICKLLFDVDFKSLSLNFPHTPLLNVFAEAEEAILLRHVTPPCLWRIQQILRIGKEHNLTKNPIVEDKIFKEIQTNFTMKTGERWQVNELDKLVYLHGALCESLRLFPPVPFNHKSPLQPDILPSGHQVDQNTKIILPFYSMGRMKSLWGEDCMEFKPERWILENRRIKHEPSYKFTAFNAGPRTCVGKNMAFSTMKMLSTTIIYNYHIELVKGHLVVPVDSVILQMKHGFK